MSIEIMGDILGERLPGRIPRSDCSGKLCRAERPDAFIHIPPHDSPGRVRPGFNEGYAGKLTVPHERIVWFLSNLQFNTEFRPLKACSLTFISNVVSKCRAIDSTAQCPRRGELSRDPEKLHQNHQLPASSTEKQQHSRPCENLPVQTVSATCSIGIGAPTPGIPCGRVRATGAAQRLSQSAASW
ncbi:hypothetical protein CALCODRAFT_14683 [Calocera cornea HHB12733]|uniref:Uncharacterized protein n=1 Tax=Calocera cornea HHB12733 TaxID=1353952 RepID=A0A165E9E1_9BASI|nr:hypothetical protein CALCODRAFT_14683 [Calocera cornea HHB12733]